MADVPEILRAERLRDVPHGFCAGMSKGVSHSGEPDPQSILPGARLVLLKQIHSPIALAVDAPFAVGTRPEADALVTATPGLVLGIATADCAPVLFADTQAGIVGAAHAGWRGAHFGVLEATVRRMEELGGTRANIRAAIGPTIAQANYEVGWDFVEQFEERHQMFFTRGRPGKWHFDLPAYVAWRLNALRLSHVSDLAVDTYANETRFHSYRRAIHHAKATAGRQYSVIALPG